MTKRYWFSVHAKPNLSIYVHESDNKKIKIMACCLKPEQVKKNSILNSHACQTWCNVNVELCGAHLFENGICTYCQNEFISNTNQTFDCFQMKERRTETPKENQQCFSNKCLACPGGHPLNVTHNTSILFSKKCNRYVPFDSASESPLIFIDFNTSSVPLNGIKVEGPGKIQSDLPIRLGSNFQFVGDLHFFSCKHNNIPAPAAITTSTEEAGKIIIEGHVDLATATSLFMSEPQKTGGEIILDENSSILMTPALPGVSDPFENVGLAALAHVTGFINLVCNSPHEFVVVQSLTATRMTSQISNCTVVNLTDLLLDFGREYEVQFFNGPEKPSVVTDILSYLLLATAVLGIVTFIFNQSKISRLATKLLNKAFKKAD